MVRIISTGIALIPMIINLYFFQIAMSSGVDRISAYIVSLFVLVLYSLMVYKQEIYKYRRIFFITTALMFVPSFISNLLEVRGQIFLEEIDIIKHDVPICHIVIPFTAIPYAFTKTVIFPAKLFNHYTSFYSILLIWLLVTLSMGRGWCSWICFYGGWDELSSSLPGKRFIKLKSKSPFIRYFNYSMLLAMVLLSLKSLSVVYCEWFCPFKLITENSGVDTVTHYLQFAVMAFLFFALLLVLPYLSRVRFQCTTFCPFGAFQSLLSRFTPFRVHIDTHKCNNCGLCIKTCPTLSLTEDSLQQSRPHMTCTLCGKCQDICKRKAIKIRFRWIKSEIFNILLSPTTYLAFVGMLMGSIIGGSFMRQTLSLLIGGIQG